MANVPSTIDIIQEVSSVLEVPEIRVWCHPHHISEEGGDDYYYTFDTFAKALAFIQTHEEAEDVPLVAFRGRELNLWAMKRLETGKEEK